MTSIDPKPGEEVNTILHRIANRIEATDMRRCAELMSREMGKPYPEAIGEVANCAGAFRYFAEMARDEGGKVAVNMEDKVEQEGEEFHGGPSSQKGLAGVSSGMKRMRQNMRVMLPPSVQGRIVLCEFLGCSNPTEYGLEM